MRQVVENHGRRFRSWSILALALMTAVIPVGAYKKDKNIKTRLPAETSDRIFDPRCTYAGCAGHR